MIKCSFCSELSVASLLVLSNGKISELNFCSRHLLEYKSQKHNFNVSKERTFSNIEDIIDVKPVKPEIQEQGQGLKSRLAEAFGIDEDQIMDVQMEVVDDEDHPFDENGFDKDGYRECDYSYNHQEEIEPNKIVEVEKDEKFERIKQMVEKDRFKNIEEENDIGVLNKWMSEAVKVEDYLLAAKVRDRIKIINASF